MTATAQDTITVAALTRDDAPDIATRQWEREGWRVLRIVRVIPATVVGRQWSGHWTVTADVEVVRR